MVNSIRSGFSSRLLFNAVTGSLELLCLFVTLLNLLVVLEEGQELTPCDELFVVDCVVLLR